MDQPVIAARVRKTKGKGAARKIRKNNQVPAVFYGPKADPVLLVVDYPELERVITQSASESILIDLQMQSDQGTETRKAMLKDLQMDFVKDTYIHVDFCEISMDKEITVRIPIRLLNTPIGVTNGGILQHVRRELTISCLPDRLIDSLDLDVSGMDIGESLHIRDIDLPEGISPVDEDHLTVTVVVAPTVIQEEAEEELEAEEEAAAEEIEEGPQD